MARVIKSVQVNDRGLMRKMSLLRNEMWLASRKTAKTLARLGVNYAAARAPYDTGQTARAIYAKPTQQTQQSTQWIIRAPDVHEDASTRVPGGSLVKYMHSNNSGAQAHFRKDRDRKFMYTTRKYLNEKKSQVAKGNFNTIKVGK